MIIKTFPGQDNYKLFEKLPVGLYNPQQVRLINNPAMEFLEGCYVFLKNNQAIARFAFYENPELIINDENAASIGSYECINDPEASKIILEFAANLALQKGYKWLIGPMEGSTWNNYRFSEHHNYQNFFMEPYHHLYYNDQFINFGFNPISSYSSKLAIKSTVSLSKSASISSASFVSLASV